MFPPIFCRNPRTHANLEPTRNETLQSVRRECPLHRLEQIRAPSALPCAAAILPQSMRTPTSLTPSHAQLARDSRLCTNPRFLRACRLSSRSANTLGSAHASCTNSGSARPWVRQDHRSHRMLPCTHSPTAIAHHSPSTTLKHTLHKIKPHKSECVFARPLYLQPRQLRDGEFPWAPRRFYSGILPCAPLHQRFPFSGALTKTTPGSRSPCGKWTFSQLEGIPMYFHPLILWMKVMVPNKLKALQFQH
jgi:hypothetical protein